MGVFHLLAVAGRFQRLILLSILLFAGPSGWADPSEFRFAKSAANANEAQGKVVVEIWRAGPSSGEASVEFRTPVAGTPDFFVPMTNRVVFADGQTNANVTVAVLDNHRMGDSNFTAELANPDAPNTVVDPASIKVKIVNSDPQFEFLYFPTPKKITAQEGANVTLTIYRSSSESTSAVKVGYLPGDAIPGVDFVDNGGTVVFKPGEQTKEFVVSLLPDRVPEINETLEVALTPAANYPGAISGTASNVVLTIPTNGFPGMVDYSFERIPGASIMGSSVRPAGIAPFPDGGLLVWGRFEQFGGIPMTNLARIKPDGRLDTNFIPFLPRNQQLVAAAVQPDGKILLATSPSPINPTLFRNLFWITRLRADGLLDDSFQTARFSLNRFRSLRNSSVFAPGPIDILPLPDGKIIVSGEFDTVDGSRHLSLARLSENGTVDDSYNPPVEQEPLNYYEPVPLVKALAALPDGSTFISLVALRFGQPTKSQRVYKVSVGGWFDPAFQPLKFENFVNADLLPSGLLQVVGTTSNLDGTVTTNPRLNADGSIDSAFTFPAQGGDLVRIQPDGSYLMFDQNSWLKRFTSSGLLDPTFVPFQNFNGSLPNAGLVAFLPDNRIILSNWRPAQGPSWFIVALHNDPTPGFFTVTAETKVVESAGEVVVKVVRLGGAAGEFIATLKAEVVEGDNAGRIALPETLVAFADGESGPKTVVFPVQDNATVDGDLRLRFYVTNPVPVGFGQNTTVVTLRDDDYGPVNPAFNGPNGVVASIIQPDGKLLMADTNGVRRWNVDGSVDSTFQPVVAALRKPCALALDFEGNLFVSLKEGVGYVVKKQGPDGTERPTFRLAADGAIHTLIFDLDGGLLVGGAFTNLNGWPRAGLGKALPNGEVDSRFFSGLQPGSVVNAIEMRSIQLGDHFIGGAFQWEGEPATMSLHSIGVVHGNGKKYPLPLPSDTEGGVVQAIRRQSLNKFLVLGEGPDSAPNSIFKTNQLIRIYSDGSLDSTFVPMVNVQPLVPGNQRLAVLSDGGFFVSGVAAINLTPAKDLLRFDSMGNINSHFNANAVEPASPLILQGDGSLFTGGKQILLEGAFFTGSPRIEQTASLRVLQGTHQIPIRRIGGTRGNMTVHYATQDDVAHQGTNYLSVAEDLLFGPGELVKSAPVTLLAAPHFAFPLPAFYLNVTAELPTHQEAASHLVFDQDNIPYSNSQDFPIASHFDGSVQTLARGNLSNFYAGGNFTLWEGLPLGGLVRLDEYTGAVDFSFQPDRDTPFEVQTLLAVASNRVMVARQLRPGTLESAFEVIRLNPYGSRDTTFEPVSVDGPVLTMALQPDGKVVLGGNFTNVTGVAHPYLARINTDGSLDPSFKNANPPDGPVRAVAWLEDSKVLVGGAFFHIGGAAMRGLARLRADGVLDPAWPTLGGIEGEVNIVAATFDGLLLVGGAFTNYNGIPATNLIELSVAGEMTSTFNATNFPNNAVTSISIDGNNARIFAGLFTGLGRTFSYGGLSETDPTGRFLTREDDRFFGSLRWRKLPAEEGRQESIIPLVLPSSDQLAFAGVFDHGFMPGHFVSLQRREPFPAPHAGLALAPDGQQVVFLASRAEAAAGALQVELRDNGVPVLTTTNESGGFAFSYLAPGRHYLRLLVRDAKGAWAASGFVVVDIPPVEGQITWKAPVVTGDGAITLELFNSPAGIYVIEASDDLQTWAPVSTNTPSLTVGADQLRFFRTRR